MNENKAREMAQAIIEKVREELRNQTARVRTGVVPDMDCLAEAIQTYTAARYVTHPAVWPKGGYAYHYTQVEVNWNDDKWRVRVYRAYTYTSLSLIEEVTTLPGCNYLLRRDGEIEVVAKGMHLRRDSASGVYFAGDCPPQEMLQAATAGPFRVEVRRTVINLEPAEFPVVLRYGDPQKRVHLRYKQHQARINLGTGELLAHLAMWRLTE
jgi:hypothetical protein